MTTLDSKQLYLAMITLFGMMYLPSPTFGYARVTSPDAMWGNVFSFLASTNHAVTVNTFALGLSALWKGSPASRLVHLHVVLFVGTYLILLLMNFLLWDSHTVEWSTVIPGYVFASATDVSVSGSTVAAVGAVAGQGFVTFSAPSELVTIVAIPMVLFNFLLLPLALYTERSACQLIRVTVDA